MRVDDIPKSYRLKEASGWQLVFSSPRLDWPIERLALTARVLGGALGEHDKMVAAATGSEILLWALQAEGGGSEIGMAPEASALQNSLPIYGLRFLCPISTVACFKKAPLYSSYTRKNSLHY